MIMLGRSPGKWVYRAGLVTTGLGLHRVSNILVNKLLLYENNSFLIALF